MPCAALRNTAGTSAGRNTAAGGVGSLFVQLARARMVASTSEQREALPRGLGAEVFLDRHAGQVAERARRAIGQELDMVADLVGHGTLAASLPMLREGGRAGSIAELAGDLEPAGRALLAATRRVLPRSRWSCFLVSRRRCSAGTAAWSAARGLTRAAAVATPTGTARSGGPLSRVSGAGLCSGGPPGPRAAGADPGARRHGSGPRRSCRAGPSRPWHPPGAWAGGWW
jgi:NADPH:quinone reductase-like Zn-dependent oxidoreductase